MTATNQLTDRNGALHEYLRPGRRDRQCRAGASWQLLWNNPKIHTPERRKIWLACDDHRDWLEEYLQTRGLWKDTVVMDRAQGPGGSNVWQDS